MNEITTHDLSKSLDSTTPMSDQLLLIDAGVGNIRLLSCLKSGEVLSDTIVPSNCDLGELLKKHHVHENYGNGDDAPIIITGKLAATVQKVLGCGKTILPAAAFWLAARDLIALPENSDVDSLAIIDLSASGYLVIGIDNNGELKDNLLVANPRCGAGSGINLDRVLLKLAVKRDEVDTLLADYLGEAGRKRRNKVTIRADRCGVFSSSATISDKNQGIPLDAALATTIKSEVLKVCNKLPKGFENVYLSGRIFRWQFARDCAEDILREDGLEAIDYDTENTQLLHSVRRLVGRIGAENLAQPDLRLKRHDKSDKFPPFSQLKSLYIENGHYLRLPDKPIASNRTHAISQRPLLIGLDVGSTMAKVVVSDADDSEILFLSAFSNAGDTIDTIKEIFKALQQMGLEHLSIRSIGITGSARYQVQQALARIYPVLIDRISVLVENYAHARGSIDHARRHIRHLKDQGHNDINEDFCILIDIGGEDTKISTIALQQAELFDNAMNLKCSAGTGSLMDTLSALFGIGDVTEAGTLAFSAPHSFAINATCAVFLMENARKLQAEGVAQDIILASANWAIVENMARSLWDQVELPKNAVVLLHGQTMLSEPLPLAVTHRLQSYLDLEGYALIPPNPGHRACIGLIRTLEQTSRPGDESVALEDFLAAKFDKRIIQCKGAACDDKSAICNRTLLSCHDAQGDKFSFTLGGCSAINELFARKQNKGKAEVIHKPFNDAYKEIWDFIDGHHPRTKDPRRLVIARSFVVSEWAYFLARIFERFKIPVHVDNVQDCDLIDAQPDFNIDSCAPHMGAVGQYRRLAADPHGVILVPQIDSLSTEGKSSGHTCTINQGGVMVARNLAEVADPDAHFHLFSLDCSELNAEALCDQLQTRLQPVFEFYGINPTPDELLNIIDGALSDHLGLRNNAAELAANLAEDALAEGRQVALVAGREYVLNPGIYDSHIRRLMRDKQVTVLPSYILDLELDEEFAHIYWRNPHFIVTLLNAVAHKSLHQRLKHPRLKKIFERIETDPSGALLPVVQVSTFSCGPDSVTAPLIAEIMKRRPFLLIQSDAIIKELAHLENRVNTYIKQLELGLHGELNIGGDGPFEIRMLDKLVNKQPLNPETDVIYVPRISDNRTVTSVLRASGLTCIDIYDDNNDLHAQIKRGRTITGDSVCAPLAAVYGDLLHAVEDFTQRKKSDDPLLRGKSRLLFFDNKGNGPCRQGQYAETHKLYAAQTFGSKGEFSKDSSGCPAAPVGNIISFMIGTEEQGYSIGLDEWAQIRTYQGTIMQAVLHDLLFQAGAECADFDEYQLMLLDYKDLKKTIHHALKIFAGPGALMQQLLKLSAGKKWLELPLKYFAYRIHGRDLTKPLRQFTAMWLKRDSDNIEGERIRITVSGEVYMRLAQSEEIFRTLLSTLGFRRFRMELSPLWSYFEYLMYESEDMINEKVALAGTRKQRTTDNQSSTTTQLHGNEDSNLKMLRTLKFFMRSLMAKPLYRAAGLKMPHPANELIDAAREIMPVLRPYGELGCYVGEAVDGLRDGVDLFINVAPVGCMVSSMGEVLSPKIVRSEGIGNGRIQNLFSADGDVDEEQITMALLRVLGPEQYYRSDVLKPKEHITTS